MLSGGVAVILGDGRWFIATFNAGGAFGIYLIKEPPDLYIPQLNIVSISPNGAALPGISIIGASIIYYFAPAYFKIFLSIAYRRRIPAP